MSNRVIKDSGLLPNDKYLRWLNKQALKFTGNACSFGRIMQVCIPTSFIVITVFARATLIDPFLGQYTAMGYLVYGVGVIIVTLALIAFFRAALMHAGPVSPAWKEWNGKLATRPAIASHGRYNAEWLARSQAAAKSAESATATTSTNYVRENEEILSRMAEGGVMFMMDSEQAEKTGVLAGIDWKPIGEMGCDHNHGGGGVGSAGGKANKHVQGFGPTQQGMDVESKHKFGMGNGPTDKAAILTVQGTRPTESDFPALPVIGGKQLQFSDVQWPNFNPAASSTAVSSKIVPGKGAVPVRTPYLHMDKAALEPTALSSSSSTAAAATTADTTRSGVPANDTVVVTVDSGSSHTSTGGAGADNDEELAKDPYPIAYCAVCESHKPPRTHHCSQCGVCVMRMDHHCVWLNNCVGRANHKHFILFVAYTLIALAYYLTLCLSMCVWYAVPRLDRASHFMFYITLPLSVYIGRHLFYMLRHQHKLITTNVTQLEKAFQLEQFHGRYSKGSELLNIQQVMGVVGDGRSARADDVVSSSLLRWALPF